jgi:8-oxo-dGTP pyrophosphatase MutT (NUDIX family)
VKFFLGSGAVLTQGDKYILVQEVRHDKAGLYNLPAGTLEVHEDLLGCITREAKEEIGADVIIKHLVGIYQTVMPSGNVLFTVFSGSVAGNAVLQSDEHEVIQALTYEEIAALHGRGKLRSPIVMKCIDDYRAGQRLPLTAVQAWHTDSLSSITVEKDH